LIKEEMKFSCLWTELKKFLKHIKRNMTRKKNKKWKRLSNSLKILKPLIILLPELRNKLLVQRQLKLLKPKITLKNLN